MLRMMESKEDEDEKIRNKRRKAVVNSSYRLGFKN